MADVSDYTPEILEKTKWYLDNYKELGDVVPTKEGLIDYLGKASSTIYKWRDEPDKIEFSETLEKIHNRQAYKLLNGSLQNELNPTISKLMLANHGYVERKDVTSDGKILPALVQFIGDDTDSADNESTDTESV